MTDTYNEQHEFDADMAYMHSLVDVMFEYLPDRLHHLTVNPATVFEQQLLAEMSCTRYVGFCDECCSAKIFTSARDRELWETYHPHDAEFGA
jgi:hypothetical protein